MRFLAALASAVALGLADPTVYSFRGGAVQTQPPRDPQPIKVRANFVRVDAYPTIDGRPVMDLRAEDFEILEDGTPQAIETFEHIVIKPPGPQATRVEPNTVEASRQAAANPRGRLFVIFLDVKHVSIEGTWHIRGPLVRLVERIVGSEDVVGIMTPEMSPGQIAFARKTDVFQRAMHESMPWGQRHTLHEDPEEKQYQNCYPPLIQEAEQGMSTSELVVKMKARRRERMTLDAIRDLSVYLRAVREERTGVIAVTEGWLLYRPDPEMTRLRKNCYCALEGGDPKTCRGCKVVDEEKIPGVDPIGIGPGGRLGRGDAKNLPFGGLKSECDRDRMALAQWDNQAYFETILDEVNRANVSFYPVDPRGLAAFDAPLGPERPPTLLQDRANFKTRHEAMYNLASATDGLPVMTTNDLDAGLKRIADDLTSYYLLGYYARNARMDGKFRRITVRVKRPGVDVRARRGYRAPTEAEVNAAMAAAPPVSAEAAAVATALQSLARIRPEARFRVHAAPWNEAGAASLVWVAGELQTAGADDPWRQGGTADIDISGGGVTATARVTLAAGERAFLTAVALPKPVAGALEVRARLAGTSPDAPRLADSLHVAASDGAPQPILFRRGSTTGNRYQPAATFLFSRTERVRVEVPVPADAKAGSGRLLERSGQPSPVPVTIDERTDADTGRRWITADVTLAPLGAGDYAIEVGFTSGGKEQKTLAAIRVVR